MENVMRIETKKILLFIVFLLGVTLTAVILFNLDSILPEDEIGTSDSASDIKKEMDTVYIDGVAYVPRRDVKNYLLIGVDELGAAEDGGVAQADFILVLSFDESAEKYTMLFVNRDTMTSVDVYDIFGKRIETREEQIALSHAYGSPFDISNSQKCINTSKSVSKLLLGVKFDRYVSMTMNAVCEIVDHIGGVSVLVEEDMTALDERLVEGEEVLLDGELALLYIRARGSLSDSSNIARMERQKGFLKAFIEKMAKTDLDEEKLLAIYDKLSPYIVTNSGIEIFDEMVEKLENYGEGEMLTFAGESVRGEKYMEFYVDEEDRNNILREIFYEKAD